jgi:hypothetical protein
VRNKPPYLTQLIVTRGRLAGELARQQAAAKSMLERLEIVRRRADKLQLRLESCDRRIVAYNERLRPELIEGIHAWREYRVSQRGGLREALIQILVDRFPDPVDTNELCLALQNNFSLSFVDAEEYARFRHNTVGNSLKFYVRKGLVKRLHDPSSVARSGVPGVWQWIGDTIAPLKVRRKKRIP